MKNLFVILIVGALLSCNNDDTRTTKTNTSTHAAYAPSDGDVTYRNGKVLVWRDDEWKEADNDVSLNDGTVVKRNGEVVRNGKVIELEDGEGVDKTGHFFDKAGNAIEDAWDATKEGAKKTKEEVKDVFTDDDKDGKNDKDKKK